MKKIILADKNDYKDVMEEEKYLFLRYILSNIGLPIEDCMPEIYNTQTVQHRIEFRKLLSKFNLVLKNTSQDSFELYLDGQKFAEWKKPFYMMKEDLSQIDTSKRKYFEIHCEFQSPFDQEQ